MTRKHFTEDFRKEAVRLALSSDLFQHQVADDLGLGHSTLSKWMSAFRHDDLLAGPHNDLQKKLTHLRKENKILREERGVIKTTAFFAS